jgi:hypothetical protein
LDFLEVDEDRLRNDGSGRSECSRCKTISEGDFEAGSKRLSMCLFAFGIGSMMGSSFFKLAAESEAIFTFSGTWTTTGLLDEGKVDRALVEGNRCRDKTCDGTDVCVSVPVRLTGLSMCVEGLINSGRQQTTNWGFAWHCKHRET